MFDFKEYLSRKRIEINSVLNKHLDIPPTGNPDSDIIVNAMKYSLMAGGKRLRPILCMASAEAVDGKKGFDEHMVADVAAALEMVHTYSLIHDDLPAMDNDDLRRGNPTCHVKFNEPVAILAGDGLLTLAFTIVAERGLKSDSDIHPKILKVMAKLGEASGYAGMVGGQVRDIGAEGKTIGLNELKELHAMKTGALIHASVYCGALLGGGTQDDVQKLSTYAQNIGLAFQVADDILNVEGDAEIMGKSTGTDEERHKAAYPALMGLNESKRFAEDLINTAISSIDGLKGFTAPLYALASYIIERKR